MLAAYSPSRTARRHINSDPAMSFHRLLLRRQILIISTSTYGNYEGSATTADEGWTTITVYRTALLKRTPNAH